jgi:hypothetical protein
LKKAFGGFVRMADASRWQAASFWALENANVEKARRSPASHPPHSHDKQKSWQIQCRDRSSKNPLDAPLGGLYWELSRYADFMGLTACWID